MGTFASQPKHSMYQFSQQLNLFLRLDKRGKNSCDYRYQRILYILLYMYCFTMILRLTLETVNCFINFLFLCKSPDTQGLKATSRRGLQQTFFQRAVCHLHVLLGLKQGYPLYSPYGCRLGYHPLEAWLAEQEALPPQLYKAIMVKCLA